MENDLGMIIERILDSNADIRDNALEMLFSVIKNSHLKPMESVNFKHLVESVHILEEACQKLEGKQMKLLCDIISAICVVCSDEKLLRYRVEGNVIDLQEWGHSYVNRLIGCIVDAKSGKISIPFLDTNAVSRACVDFLFRHNAEFEAIDFLLETGAIGEILKYVDTYNYNRILLYLEDMSHFLDLRDIILELNLKTGNHSRYVVGLIGLQKVSEAVDYVRNMQNDEYKKQCLHILARCGVYYEADSPEERYILSNCHIRDTYRAVAAELELEKPEKMDVILKGVKYDKDVEQLGPVIIANAFIHMGHGRDPVFFPKEDDVTVPLDYKLILGCDTPNLVSMFASVGVILSWDSEKTMDVLHEHMFSESSYRKAGGFLGLALSGLRNPEESQVILSLLSENLKSDNSVHVMATLLGIQAMFSGTKLENLRKLLYPLMFSDNNDVAFFSAFTLGSIFCGSADEDLVSLMLQMFLERNKEYDTPFFKLLILGLACLFYCRPDVECKLSEMGGFLNKHGSLLVKGFQHIKTGSAEVIESILAESLTGDADVLLESFGLLSCALVAIGDDISTQMVTRFVSSSLPLGSPHLKSVLPLCYSILYPSNPNASILDVLEKFLNTGEISCVVQTILSLGLIGAGTSNARITKMLDQQYSYYHKDRRVLSVLKISQALPSLGKGLLTISPLYFDRTTLIPKCIIGLFFTVFMFLGESVSPLISSHSYMFFMLCQACSQKYVMCSEKINMRVGFPINTVGVVGEPRKISSIQTHVSPIILDEKVRAETDDPVCSSYIEGVLVLKRNQEVQHL